jgi:hypothetical protein
MISAGYFTNKPENRETLGFRMLSLVVFRDDGRLTALGRLVFPIETDQSDGRITKLDRSRSGF